MRGVPHYMLDIANPKRVMSVSQYQKKANTEINKILKRGKLPIICGGTGFYIQALVDGVIFPEVKPDKKLRRALAKKSMSELGVILKKLDQKRFKEIDTKNPHRLIRAIEIAKALGKVPKIKAVPLFETLQVGIRQDDGILKQKINLRLKKRLKAGMLGEAKKLQAGGLSYKRMEAVGLEYRYMARHLQGKISKQEMAKQLEAEIWHYAKRQMTWFKKDRRIKWFEPEKLAKIKREVQEFLN
jgi:tRNA dimethylallyltransferase